MFYRVPRGPFAKELTVKAVDGVSFTLAAGKTLAVVGESGCGKSTLARIVTMIEAPTAGRLVVNGEDVTDADRDRRKALRAEIQIVFQDPYGSLNPRQ
ncbi:MAG: ATP-binding cassette domain-containing protein, partial [Kiloniellales bacterium]|nr:ATP-binding cassette domain-containing protein [Kiloniellales bacterium]